MCESRIFGVETACNKPGLYLSRAARMVTWPPAGQLKGQAGSSFRVHPSSVYCLKNSTYLAERSQTKPKGIMTGTEKLNVIQILHKTSKILRLLGNLRPSAASSLVQNKGRLQKKLRDYLGIFPKWWTPPPLLGTPRPKNIFMVYFAF